MPKINMVQNAFLAGELSPRMEMRDDSEGRKYGVEKLDNFFIHLQGTIETSYGFEYIADTDGNYGRIFPFHVALYTSFIITITPETVWINDQTGYVYGSELVLNGDFLDGSADWIQVEPGTGTVSFSNGTAKLNPGNINPDHVAGLQQSITVIDGDNYSMSIGFVSGEGPITINIGTTQGGSDIFTQLYTTSSSILIENIVASGTTMWIEAVVAGTEATKYVDIIKLYSTQSGVAVPLEFPSPWTSISEIEMLQAKMAPGEVSLYITSPATIMQILHYDVATRSWTLEPADFTNMPTQWGVDGYPQAIDFFEGRLYLGGAPKYPETFWATRPGRKDDPDGWEKYRDFELGTDADHALEHTIEHRGRIYWISGARNLVIGTERAEHIITSQDGVIIPGDIESRIQSTHGSIPMQALEIGNEVMYVSSDGRKIWSMGYDWTKEAWASKDITFASEHITKNAQIQHLVYAANPYSIIYGHNEDQELIGCSFEPQSQTGGFFHRKTNGKIISACTLTFGGTDELWVLVDRDEEGPRLSLERASLNRNIKLDSYKRYTSVTPTPNWTAPHLGEMLCQIIADGAIHKDVTLDINGNFTLDYPVEEVYIGLQFISYMRTLSIGMSTQYIGTTRPAKKRWNKLWARITASWKPKINGTRPPTRHVITPMGSMEPPITESVKVTNLGWDIDGKIEIEQDLPVPTEIAGYFGNITQEGI